MKSVKPKDPLFPRRLLDISQKTTELYYLGPINKLNDLPVVSIVGSRAVTTYGKQVTLKLAYQLASNNIAIVSGLALGVDALAHRAALEAGGYTAAVLPSPVNKVYPATNRQLAAEIVSNGGVIVSEYSSDDRSQAFKSRFIERNRIVSGLSDVLLVTEAGERSGTLHTANFALDQGRTVMAVPGNITSPNSRGTNYLIKAGAVPVTSIEDILSELNLTNQTEQMEILPANKEEAIVLSLMQTGITDISTLQLKSGLQPSEFNQIITILEINGKIKPIGGGSWSLRF